MTRKNVKKRAFGREFALKALYQRDIHNKLDQNQLASLVQTEELDEIPEFGRQLIEGCMEQIEILDDIIQKVAMNWRLDRMPTIDRNILRIGAYELLFCPETPHKVAINEAIELSKLYSTEDSPNFINGVLDKIYTDFALPKRSGGATSENTSSRSLFPTEADIPPVPEKSADLHLHSSASDGNLSPSALIKEINRCGLEAISLTDHDSIDGVEEAMENGKKQNIVVVPGVEMSAYTPGPDGEREFELHILGYFVDIYSRKLIDELKRLQKIRVDRVRKIAVKLATCGIDIDAERIIKENHSTVGRLHIAIELVEKGTCKNIEEAFEKYLGSGKPAYEPKDKLSVPTTIDLIHEAGGCAVLAHPGLSKGIESKIDELVDAGLDGIEVHYPEHNAKTEAFWMNLAQEKDLIITGGSDYHGDSAAPVTIGQETVSFVELNGLLHRAAFYRQETRRETANSEP